MTSTWLRRQVEQTASLNDLKSLVHQGGRVNGDALAHLPRGMVQRLLDRDVGKIRLWRVKERSAGSGQPDALDFFHPAATQALVDGIVLAVDGQQRLALAAGLGGDQFSGGDQAFLVGQADCFARFTASYVASSPATPTMALTTKSASG